MVRPRILWISLAVCASAGMTCTSAFAADDNGSMDSIWVDQSVRQNAAKTAAQDGLAPAAETVGATAAPAGDLATTTATTTSLDTAAPMCSVGAFKDSPLATGSGWAGLGPFRSTGGDGGEFVDDKMNRVRLDISGDQITRAELTIANYQPSRDPYVNLLNMQMNIDFLLESVGIKPGRITSLNAALERQRDALLNGSGPLNLTTGRYAVIVDKHPSTTSGVNYVIAVNSMDVNKKLIKQPWISDKPKPENRDMRVTLPQEDKPKAAPVDKGQLKAQFTQLVTQWQKVKKEAVRSKQSEQLATVLAGRALARQTEAVKWLVTNHRYYDMTPRGVTVDQLTEIVPSKKYMVATQVHEAYKLIDDTSGKVLKEVDAINKVNYTIERVGDKWVISDSNLLSASNSPNNKPH